MRKGTILKTTLIITLVFSLLGCSKKPSTIPETEMSSVTVESSTTEKATEASTKATEKETKTEKKTTSTEENATTMETLGEVVTETEATAAPTTEAATETSGEGVTEGATTVEVTTEAPTQATEVAPTTQPEPPTQPTTEAPKHEHSYTSQVTKEATCSSEGVLTYTCSCGHSYTESIPMLSHNYTSAVTKNSTCTETGVLTYVCTGCNNTYTESIPMLSHSFGDYVYNNDATTESNGTKTRTCSTCGYQETVTAEGTKLEGPTYAALPEESCPYPLHQVIDNGDGTYSLYYVDGRMTMEKYGINTLEGDWAMADFHAFCDRNYLEIGFYAGMGDYKEGCIVWTKAFPY